MAETNHSLNPAGRLWLFLEYFRAANPNDTIGGLWRTYFSLPPDSTEAYADSVGAVLSLPGQIREAIDGIRNPVPSAATLKRPLSTVARMLAAAVPGGDTASWLITNVGDANLVGLEYASEVLNGHIKQGELSEDTITKVRAYLSELLTSLADETIGSDLRDALADHILAMIRLLDLRKAVGAGALVAEVDRFAAQTQRLAPEPADRPGVLKRLLRLGAAIVLTVDVFAAPVTIADALEKYVAYYGQLELPVSTQAPADPDEIVLDTIDDDQDRNVDSNPDAVTNDSAVDT